MPEPVGKLHRERTRFYTTPGRTHFYSASRNHGFNSSYARTGYFSQPSRKNLVGGFSRLSTTKSGFTSSFSGENELECQNILCKRGFLKRIFYSQFNNLFNTDIKNNNNCKKYGAILLTLFFLNLCITVLAFIAKDPVTCRKELTDYSTGTSHMVTINPQDCNLKSGGKGFKIDHDKIYVYYNILNYPFHFSSVFKLHSKLQFQGKISRVNSDLDLCGAYSKLHANGLHRVINPCGSHVVNVYNDQFKFLRPKSESRKNQRKVDESSADDGAAGSSSIPGSGDNSGNSRGADDGDEDLREWDEMKLDDRKELLIRHHEYGHSRNISKEDRLTFNDYYWMGDTVEYSKEINIGMSRDFELLNGWNYNNRMYHQLNSEVSGVGVRNGHFVQWMSPAPFPDFTKLYGVLEGPAEVPLTFKFVNNYNVTAFHGKKFLVLKASSYNIGNILFLRVLFMLFTLLSLSFGLLFTLYRPKNQNSIFNLI
ncbi:uncharacterized protein TOT_010000593 [Theileria orientalis strain Shintoku]|uniref:LEM3/CDC50 family protein n=1 Tax=Theileria orientalis strain Shintoku TaxID=869250 RepID=J4CCC1_THEOR|nr:uncharacterized protein TOT_010000593 [Theileria orientalis strain Shintoku]PVC52855.1 hypothetical protein MACL_00000489 [Theileria orientalis]BAM39132.1 uncharacterized protein TOT_010000593 [Theileria orientalis strain Shintoku]|eukprot:XP_009689433.1 uncharacterized protein TOT_010000593 [Theileria orientalis strain Shintoku]